MTWAPCPHGVRTRGKKICGHQVWNLMTEVAVLGVDVTTELYGVHMLRVRTR